MPVEAIRRYYGEDIGLYFAFLQVYTKMLVWPGLFGLLVTIMQFVNQHASANGNAATLPFAIFICLWVQVFLSQWRRTQALYSFRWGTEGYEEKETARRQFEGDEHKITTLKSALLYGNDESRQSSRHSARASLSSATCWRLYRLKRMIENRERSLARTSLTPPNQEKANMHRKRFVRFSEAGTS